MHGNIFIYYFITLVGYEARNIDMRDLLHNPNPESTLYIPGTIYTNYKFNVSIKLLINKIFIKKRKLKIWQRFCSIWQIEQRRQFIEKRVFTGTKKSTGTRKGK